MREINNANVVLEYNLNNYDDPNESDDLYHVVVQKGNVGSSYVYALQLLHGGTNHRESDALTTINKIFRVSWN